MDSSLIFEKTAAGEEAMHQRTRVVQRNQRMVLILVDGKSSVAELCTRAGNMEMVERALAELEQGGFIQARAESASAWEQRRQAVREIGSAALEQVSQFSTFSQKPAETKARRSDPPAASRTDGSSSPPAAARAEPGLADLPVEDISIFGLEPDFNPPPVAPAAAEPRGGFFSALLTGKGSPDKVHIKPIRRGNREPALGWPARIGLAAGALAVLLGLLVFLFPYERYRPELEASLSRLAGQPATVGALRVSFSPRPALELDNVRVGVDGHALRIGAVRLVPTLSALAGGDPVFRELRIAGASVPAEMLGVLASVFGSGISGSNLRFERVILEGLALDLGGLTLPAMDGEVQRAADGSFATLNLQTPGHSLQLTAQARDAAFALTLEGSNWRLTNASPWLFDSLVVKGVLQGRAFAISEMELRLLDGIVHGTARVGGEASPLLSGSIDFERISARRFGQALGLGELLAGDIDGRLQFVARAAEWSDLPAALEGSGSVAVKRGSVIGIDLAEAARRVSKKAVVGGSTRFELLTANLRLTPDLVRFNPLVVSSGLMQSVGRLDVDRQLRLSGAIDIEMKGTNRLRVPMSFAGTLRSPELDLR
ncbi:AsmA-like C-terminal region-containing protein [Rhodocyclus tenuis]|uniref:AsmA-like C-terminal region-containing protein n=1 Tax=Rhodocyclus tenuis TaxID=1066 RepID=UPI0019067CF0|nr:AsmA-like C-terminal region-containing protein [Rhodocyclus tenuis]MBK1679104.1 hypothetical protein [Rhodocyclus tenuis]